MTMTSKNTSPAWASKYKGLTSIPTDTKNRTANVSRNGTISAPTWWLSADSLTTTPARKAPSARETPKTDEAPIAVPIVITTIATMKSSRERMCARCRRNQGMMRVPATNISAANIPAFSRASPAVCQSGSCVFVESVGSSTRMRTATRSSSTSQPTATRPCEVLSSP